MKRVLSFFAFIVLTSFCLTSCSVSGVNPKSGNQLSPDASSPAPTQPSSDSPSMPSEPILVSEPMPVVPPNSDPVNSVADSTPSGVEEAPITPIAIIEETPTSPEVVVIDTRTIVQITTPETTSAPSADPDANLTDSDTDADSDSSTGAEAIGAGSDSGTHSDVTSVNPQQEAQPTSPSLPNSIPEPILAAIDDMVPATQTGDGNLLNPPVAGNSPETSENDDPQDDDISPPPQNNSSTAQPPAAETLPNSSAPTGQVDPAPIQQNEEETEGIIVEGRCMGKKKVGVLLIDTRDKKKQKNTSVQCKNDKFVIKFTEKKKDHPFLQIQTVFFD